MFAFSLLLFWNILCIHLSPASRERSQRLRFSDPRLEKRFGLRESKLADVFRFLILHIEDPYFFALCVFFVVLFIGGWSLILYFCVSFTISPIKSQRKKTTCN